MESTAGVRRFTIFAWLLWTLIPALAVAAFGYVTDSATRSAGNADPASVMAGISAGFLMIVLLVPVVTTLQWLVLRRAWPRLVWPAWLLVVFVSILATLVAEPIVVMRTHSWLYGEIPPVLTIALAAAAVLAVAKTKAAAPFRIRRIIRCFSRRWRTHVRHQHAGDWSVASGVFLSTPDAFLYVLSSRSDFACLRHCRERLWALACLAMGFQEGRRAD